MNNKGFMMAEVVVVSSIILVALVALYASHNKILSAYNKRVDYYDINTLYELAYIEDTTDLTGKSSQEEIIIEDPSNLKTVYYLNKNHISSLKEIVNNQTFKDYLDYLLSSNQFNKEYILVMERCLDADVCKYAYLEVSD